MHQGRKRSSPMVVRNQVGPVPSQLESQRNERLMQHAQQQMELDNRMYHKAEEHHRHRAGAGRKLPPALAAPDPGGRDASNTNVEKPKPRSGELDNTQRENENQPKTSASLTTLQRDGLSASGYRLDAVVFVIVLAQLMGYIAIGIEIYVYSLDQYWNKVLIGEKALHEIKHHNVFRGKTYNLAGHEYLRRARDYATREEPLEILFIVFIILFMVVSTVHIFACYIKTDDFERYSGFLIGLYAFGGALCIICSTFLITSLTNIENNYQYAADMLHNFQHVFENGAETEPPVTGPCPPGQFLPGCEFYEYSKRQAHQLESIFRLCSDGSRFTRYYKTGGRVSSQSVKIEGETYLRSDLKNIGFCSRDGFKIVAGVFAALMGMLCSIVPVIYCCESRSVSNRESYKTQLDLDIRRKSGRKSIPGEHKKSEHHHLDKELALAQFIKYVQQDSQENIKAQS